MTKRIPEREHGSTRPPASAAGIEELATANLALLAELERSLQASQEALLALDVGEMELSTQEQMRLSRALEILLAPPRQLFRNEQRRPDLGVELRAAAKRVLELTRIQAALLERARRFLVILSNLVAGGNYAAPVFHRGITTPPAS